MTTKEFSKFTNNNKLISIDVEDSWFMRLWFEYGDFIEVRCYEDGFDFTYQGELYEPKDNSRLINELELMNPNYLNDMIKKYGNCSINSEGSLLEILSKKTQNEPTTAKNIH